MIKCPCKECVPPVRTPGCHSHCDLYKAWKAEYEELNKPDSVYSAMNEYKAQEKIHKYHYKRSKYKNYRGS